MATTIYVLNGPNLNLLGTREPEIYGRATLKDVEAMCREAGKRHGFAIAFHQSNHEGALVDLIQEARAKKAAGIVINPAGYTTTSVAILDALLAVNIPTIEVHISNIHARDEFRRHGITLEEVAITSTSEVFQAAQVLTARNIQAFWITGDNTVLQAFEGVVKVADDHRLPLVINDPEFTDRGALACAGLGFYQSGRAAAALAARVLLGEDPRHIPIEEVAVKKLVLNDKVARKLGVTFSPALIKEASL